MCEYVCTYKQLISRIYTEQLKKKKNVPDLPQFRMIEKWKETLCVQLRISTETAQYHAKALPSLLLFYFFFLFLFSALFLSFSPNLSIFPISYIHAYWGMINCSRLKIKICHVDECSEFLKDG